MEPLQAALMYRGLGWAVVPVHTPSGGGCSCGRADCPTPGKHPRVRWQVFEEAAPSVDHVKQWWHRWADANIGVLTGSVSGVAVIDVDPRNGGAESLALLTSRWGRLEGFAETRTGGGGRHLWFTVDRVARAASRIIDQGLELKAEGSLVVVPPSLHASGACYEWAPGREPWVQATIPLPEWLIAEEPAPDRPAEDAGAFRTDQERSEFADLWAEVGVVLRDGDRYYLCPFHADEHPSLHVDAATCRWYCFGCRQGGGPGRLARLLGHSRPSGRRERKTGQVGRPRPVSLRGRCDVPVVGESHHQDELLHLVGGRRPFGGVDVRAVGELRPDAANPADRDAIEVFVDDQPVGFLRHDDAVAYRALVEEALDLHGYATCWARIKGGWDRGHGEVGAFGVTLELPAPDDL